MKQLLSVRTNIFYFKKDDDFKRQQELIFLVDEPSYTYSNEGEIIRERGISEVRFTVSETNFDTLIKLLTEFKNAEEEELK